MSRTILTALSTALFLGAALAAGPAAAETPAAPPAPPAAPAAAPAAPAAAPADTEPADADSPAAPTDSAQPAAAPQTTAAAGPLRVADVVKAAQERFPLVIAATAEKQGAEADLLAARGGFDPIFRTSVISQATGAYPSVRADTAVEQPTPLWGASLFAGYRIGVGKFADYDGKLETNDGGELRAGVRIPVLRDGPIDRRRATIQRAELAVEIAKLGADQQKIEITRQAAQRYWDWAGAGAQLTVVEQWLALAERRNTDLKTRVARGDLPEIEQLENERSVLARRAQLAVSERRLEQAAIDLSLIYRNADGSPSQPARSQLPGTLPEPPVAEPAAASKDVETDALARRPEPRRAEAARASAEVELTLARNQALPAIDLYAAGSADLGPGDAKRGLPVLEVGVLIDIPILGRPQKGRVQAGEAAVKRADKHAELARDRVGAELKDGRSAMDAARKRAEVATQEIALAEKLEAAERRRFDLGDSNMLTVNLREQATIEARIRRIDALVDYQKAAAAYRAAQGLTTAQ